LIQKMCSDKKLHAVVFRVGTIFGYSIGMRFHTAVNKFLYQAGRGAVYSFSSVTNRGWISLANSWFRKSIFLEIGGTKDLPSNVIVDDRILALRLRPHGKIAYLNGSAVRTSNWLTEKKKWVSGLLEELEQVKVLANIPQ